MDGEHYRFVDEAAFGRAIDAGEFVEHETYREHLYGTPWSEVRRALEGSGDVLFEIDVRGARSIKDLYPEAIAIFLYPRSEAVLAERLRGRGTDAPEHIAARLATAEVELRQKDAFDHAVLNDEVSEAVADIEGILGLRSAPEERDPS